MSVIKRLPRYYRFLGELKKNNITRISSKELSQRMGLTASQIRQDLNCFGGFGQQGYGYNVEQLYNEIGSILGINNGYKTIISHRSGETEDNYIADFAVGLDLGQIKTGSLSRTDRICKYNQLMRIENEIESN